ncbi:T9SS type A sorting domain-containing protein [uncultured Pontibacter sp.]|uniref:T9SS type A sorting domain-containing protein n=1 Tax=uncultured Pontibacter sp. TaxID=453356 RepID=UPI00260EF69F|nr:T9SS type A sorting domain-containing protein [uncultured Pontibacter sp.]
MKKIHLLLCLTFLLFVPIMSQATHIYSGHISYTVDPQNPLRYNFVLTISAFAHSPADEPYTIMAMGDGNTVRVERNIPTIRTSRHYTTQTFSWTYTYETIGNYLVQWTSENRNGGIINIGGISDQVSLNIYTRVKVGATPQNLNGAKLAGSPIIDAFVGEPWTHNLLAYDADGDYLMYKLVTPRHKNQAGQTDEIPNYTRPVGLTINEFGELHWPSPVQKGQYVIAVLITEMRDGREVGSMLVDFTMNVLERSSLPTISIINKDRLTINADGSIQTWPGQPVKLEFYLRENAESDQPLTANAFGEIDTLQLVASSLSYRDTLGGFAVTYTFTPSANLERTEPYLMGMRARQLNRESNSSFSRDVEFDWAFAYFYIGEQRRPLSSGDNFPPERPKLYPNPARGEFAIEAPDLPGLHLLVRDITGKVVASYTLRPGRNDFIRPAKLASGLYTYTLTSRLSPIETGKLVLQ